MKISVHLSISQKIVLTLMTVAAAAAVDIVGSLVWSWWSESLLHILAYSALLLAGMQVSYLLGYEQHRVEHPTLRPGGRYVIAGPVEQPWVMMGLATADDEAEVTFVMESEYARRRAFGGFNS